MPTITPKGWDTFQHYKDRKPAWIKLHRDLLDNYDFHCLPVASRALAPCLWLLASEYDDGQIPSDYRLIAFRLRMSTEDVEKAIIPLISTGFFIASDVLADCKRSACLEREEEREEEKDITPHYVRSSSDDKSPDHGEAASAAPKADRTDYQGVVDLYHQILCPPMQRCLILNKTRKAYIRQRWLDCMGELAEWEAYFRHVEKSDFLMGRANGTGQRRPFIADLEWLCRPNNFAKVAEGKYHK